MSSFCKKFSIEDIDNMPCWRRCIPIKPPPGCADATAGIRAHAAQETAVSSRHRGKHERPIHEDRTCSLSCQGLGGSLAQCGLLWTHQCAIRIRPLGSRQPARGFSMSSSENVDCAHDCKRAWALSSARASKLPDRFPDLDRHGRHGCFAQRKTTKPDGVGLRWFSILRTVPGGE
jgi:hypothetical protein